MFLLARHGINFQKKLIPESIEIAGRIFPLVIRKSDKARQLTIRLKQDKKTRIILTSPLCISVKTLINFVNNSLPWLENQINLILPVKTYHDGMRLNILGKSYEINHKNSLTCRFWRDDNSIIVYAPAKAFGSYLQKMLQQIAYCFLHKQTLFYAGQINRLVNKITLRDTYSRWGSCTLNGNISYSWRLVFAPLSVIEYVCAHEVAHLVEMNHSKQFWDLVKKLCPEYLLLRQWLRQNGKSLFCYEP